MGQKFYDESDIQAIAAAIRAKNGSQNTYTVAQMPAAIQAIPSQDNTLLDSLINRSIAGIQSDVVSVGYYAFYNCSSLTTVEFPEATSIGNYAFYYCEGLTTIEFPKVTRIGSYAFQYCHSLTTVEFPKATYIDNYAFRYCTGLTAVILKSRATLANVIAFDGANNAIIYVLPEDLTWYSTATNWSTLYAQNRIKSIAELPGM